MVEMGGDLVEEVFRAGDIEGVCHCEKCTWMALMGAKRRRCESEEDEEKRENKVKFKAWQWPCQQMGDIPSLPPPHNFLHFFRLFCFRYSSQTPTNTHKHPHAHTQESCRGQHAFKTHTGTTPRDPSPHCCPPRHKNTLRLNCMPVVHGTSSSCHSSGKK